MGALFSLSFDKFVAPTVAKIVYALAMIGAVVGYLSAVAAGFNDSIGTGLLFLLVLGPLGAVLYLAFVRVIIEALLATILTAQNTAELVRRQGGGPAPHQPQSGPAAPDAPTTPQPPGTPQ